MDLKEEQGFKHWKSFAPSKALLWISVIVYLAFQMVLLWTSIQSLCSNDGILRDVQKTADRITQMELALQDVRSTLRRVITEKELLKIKYTRGHRFYHRRMRRQSFELMERIQELEMR